MGLETRLNTPSIMLLRSWDQICDLNNVIAGALLTGNYGMWNAYAIIMMILYAPPASTSRGKYKMIL